MHYEWICLLTHFHIIVVESKHLLQQSNINSIRKKIYIYIYTKFHKVYTYAIECCPLHTFINIHTYKTVIKFVSICIRLNCYSWMLTSNAMFNRSWTLFGTTPSSSFFVSFSLSGSKSKSVSFNNFIIWWMSTSSTCRLAPCPTVPSFQHFLWTASSDIDMHHSWSFSCSFHSALIDGTQQQRFIAVEICS